MNNRIKFSNLIKLNLLLYLIPCIIADRDAFDGELLDIEFRVAIDAGKKDCFYQLAKMDHTLEISFQVINSKLSWMYPLHDINDLRISFELHDPYNRLIIRRDNVNSDTYVHTVKTEGVYALCFDNSNSRIASKIIGLELYLYSDQDDDRWNMNQNVKFEEENRKYADSMEILKASVNRIRDNLQIVSHNQDKRRAIENRDSNIMNSLSRFINWFSVISLIMIPLVGFCQLVLIKSLFEHKSKFNFLFIPIPFFDLINLFKN